jgi:hypothetical protein
MSPGPPDRRANLPTPGLAPDEANVVPLIVAKVAGLLHALRTEQIYSICPSK